MANEKDSKIEVWSKLVQILSVVTGVVISVLSFTKAVHKDADARMMEIRKYYDDRKDEMYKRKLEAARPFLQLRQERYLEVIKLAAILANPEDHTAVELSAAKKRFGELYVAELSMVEAPQVEANMVALGRAVDPKLLELTPRQKAAYDLAHALRGSLTQSWDVTDLAPDQKPSR